MPLRVKFPSKNVAHTRCYNVPKHLAMGKFFLVPSRRLFQGNPASPITGNNNGRQAKQKAIKKGALLKIKKKNEKETGEKEILAAKFLLFIVPRRVNYTT